MWRRSRPAAPMCTGTIWQLAPALRTSCAKASSERRSPGVVPIDDDVYAPPGWLRALMDGARRHPEAAVVGGPIRARFEGPAPRGCGREQPPITTLDLGPADVETELVWSANMALRRSAFELAGPFDESFSTGGDEE